jgi:hypothetical protein
MATNGVERVSSAVCAIQNVLGLRTLHSDSTVGTMLGEMEALGGVASAAVPAGGSPYIRLVRLRSRCLSDEAAPQFGYFHLANGEFARRHVRAVSIAMES